MRSILVVFAVFFAKSSWAVDLNIRLDDACYTELSFFCQQTPKRLEPRLKCLRDHNEVLTAQCANGIDRVVQILAQPKPVETAIAVSTAAVPAAPAKAAMVPVEMETHLTRFEGSVYVHLSGMAQNQFIKADKAEANM